MSSLLNKFFGKDDDFVNVNSKIDDLINLIPHEDNKFNTEEHTGKIIDTFVSSAENSEISKIYQSIGIPTDRVLRYALYEEMYKIVPIIKKIISTYIANIIPKNPANGKCIIYRDAIDSPSDYEKYRNSSRDYLKDIVEYFDIINKYKNIILPRRLLYGDCFVEVVDVSSEFKDIDLNKQYATITESQNYYLKLLESEIDKDINGSNLDIFIEKTMNMFIDIEETVNSDDKWDPTNVNSNNNDADQIKKDDADDKLAKQFKKSFENILLKIHKPSDIVILTTKYGSTIGYLEILRSDTNSNSYTQMLATIVAKISSAGNKNNINQETMINKMIYYILKKILGTVKKTNPNISDANEAIRTLDPEVYLFIKRLFIEQGLYNKNIQNSLKVRFIPPTRMVQFKTTSIDYDPYGESIIDGIILPCKLYTLSQLSNTVSKLSRASVTRKWTLEAGSSRMHSQMVQKLRRELNNTKMTLGDYSSLKNAPKIFSDYKDMITIKQNGNPTFDVEVLNVGDPSINVADLEDARKEIIALSGIPAPYLGYMDQVELKEQLVHTSVAFATVIMDMQEQDISSLNKLAKVIANIQKLNYNPTKYVEISLIPPTVLVLQMIEMTISSVGNIGSVFMNMGVDTDMFYFLRQYVPHVDWDKFLAACDAKSIKDKTKSDLGGSAGAQPAGNAPPDDGSGGM